MRTIQLTVPSTTGNDFVLDEWLVGNGAAVMAGSPVCKISFKSKLSDEPIECFIEYEATASGLLHHEFSAGSELVMGQMFGWIEIA